MYKGRKLIAAMLCLVMLFSMCYAAEPKSEQETIISELVENYLSNLARNRFLYENNDIKTMTINSAYDTSLVNRTFSLMDSRTVQFSGNSLTVGEMKSNIDYVSDMATFESYSREKSGITRNDFSVLYNFDEINTSNEAATVRVAETMSFQYTDDPKNTEPSYLVNHFELKLMNVSGEWYIADVTDEYSLTEESKDEGFDLKVSIEALDKALIEDKKEATVYSNSIEAD